MKRKDPFPVFSTPSIIFLFPLKFFYFFSKKWTERRLLGAALWEMDKEDMSFPFSGRNVAETECRNMNRNSWTLDASLWSFTLDHHSSLASRNSKEIKKMRSRLMQNAKVAPWSSFHDPIEHNGIRSLVQVFLGKRKLNANCLSPEFRY